MKLRLILFFVVLVAAPLGRADFSERITLPQGANYDRMWNWVLADSAQTGPREKPVIAIAECTYSLNRLEGKGHLDSPLLLDPEFYAQSRPSPFRQRLSDGEFALECNTAFGNSYPGTSNLTDLARVPLRGFMANYRPKYVSAYGSDRHYLGADGGLVAGSDRASSHDFIARELIDNCVHELTQDLGGIGGVTPALIADATSIKHVTPLTTDMIKDTIEKKVSGEASVVSGAALILSTGGVKNYSFSMAPLYFTSDERRALYQGLISELTCREGPIWFESGLIALNECDQKINEIQAKLDEGPSEAKIALSGAACGIARRLEGTGNMLYGALTCGLTEVLNGCQNASVVEILTNTLALTASTFIAGAVPNGDYLSGGHTYNQLGKNRPHVQRALLGSLYYGALRGVAFGGCAAARKRQIVGNSAAALSVYVGLGSAANERFRYDLDQFGEIPANTVNELLSGSVPGMINASCRQDTCVDRLQAKLASIMNVSSKKALPSELMMPSGTR